MHVNIVQPDGSQIGTELLVDAEPVLNEGVAAAPHEPWAVLPRLAQRGQRMSQHDHHVHPLRPKHRLELL